MPVDLDRRDAKKHLPDHGDLPANFERWASHAVASITAEGPG